MYQPAQFIEDRPQVLQQLMHDHPFAALVMSGQDGLNADHLPFEFDPEPAPCGTLRAHVARSNPLWKQANGTESLVIFQGPQTYISPGWYPTKQDNGRAVPTWNYMVVHAYGAVRAVEDKDWIKGLLGRLSAHHEAGRAQPWSLEEAPPDYIDKLLDVIVGIEIPLTRVIGKWKVSQNQPMVNRVGVEQELREQGGDQSLAMAQAVREHIRD